MIYLDMILLHSEGKCDYFQWQDDPGGGNRFPSSNSGTAASAGSNRYQQPPTSFQGSTGSRNSAYQQSNSGTSNVICSRCRQAGHYARECPSR